MQSTLSIKVLQQRTGLATDSHTITQATDAIEGSTCRQFLNNRPLKAKPLRQAGLFIGLFRFKRTFLHESACGKVTKAKDCSRV